MNARAAHIASAVAALLCLPYVFVAAQAPPPAQHPSATFRDSLDTYVTKHAFRLDTPAGSEWLDGGLRYTALEASAADPKRMDLVAYTTATGARSILVPAARFVPEGKKDALDFDSYTWSSDKKQLLLFTNTQRVWRTNTRGGGACAAIKT